MRLLCVAVCTQQTHAAARLCSSLARKVEAIYLGQAHHAIIGKDASKYFDIPGC